MSKCVLISGLSIILPVLVLGRFKLNKVRIERDFNWFVYYLLASALVEVTNIVFTYRKITTIELSHVYHIIEFGLLAFTLINWERDFRILFYRIALLLTIVISIDQLFIENISQYGIYGLFISGLALCSMSARVIFLLTVRNTNSFRRDGRYWIALGVLSYFSAKMILLPLFTQFHFHFPFDVHLAINLLSNLLFTVGMICHYNKMRYLSTLCF